MVEQVARLAIRSVVDFALPPRCPGCGAITPEPHLFCLTCWSRLQFLGEPCCDRCALPFDFAIGNGGECAACIANPPDFDRLRAAVAYGDISRKVALRLKYGGRPGIAETLARLMERHAGQVADSRPWLAPVPLHRWRIWRRGYNQSALIATALARRLGLETRPDLIERTRATPPLRGMSPSERKATLRGAFQLPERHRSSVQGRSILLIDDVYTSGATANACARLLKRAGAERVDILCWTRVLGPDRGGDSIPGGSDAAGGR